ncbi:MAG: hypothetical protein CMM77_12305 [Rhodospirillaceae bacterium]|nr:hypothetical protein [Magnetovibrio sp.]MAY67896.1 hypothetical protein [Rhodospirillaceae bacterium]
MAIYAEILTSHRLVVASLSGRVDIDSVRHVIIQLKSRTDFVWNFDRIVFVDGATDFSRLDMAELAAIKEAVARAYFSGSDAALAAPPYYRFALVCGGVMEGIIGKMFATLLDVEATPMIDMKVCRSAAEALSWLGRDTLAAEDVLKIAGR